MEKEINYERARKTAIAKFEREFLADALERNEGNVSRTARASGMDRVYLHRLIRRHSLGGWPRQSAEPRQPAVRTGDTVQCDFPDGSSVIGKAKSVDGDEVRIEGEDGADYATFFSVCKFKVLASSGPAE